MPQLGAALTGSNTSSTFRVTNPCDVHITITGTFNSQTVTMKQCLDGANGTFVDFTADGTAVTFTANNNRKFDLPAGWYRFTADGVTSVIIDVDGKSINLSNL